LFIRSGAQASLPAAHHKNMPKQHKGWYSRSDLPHFDNPNVVQGVTFRLHDSLPKAVVKSLSAEISGEMDSAKRQKIEELLNAGYGECYLKELKIGRIVEETLLHFDNERYRLIAWVIMPNHVHVLFQQWEGHLLSDVVGGWKSFSASKINAQLGRKGKLWFPDYFDRFIRDEQHFLNAVNSIYENPVKAGLVEFAEDWPLGSARFSRF
jgi:REP element-mobilizing transposase RayT